MEGLISGRADIQSFVLLEDWPKEGRPAGGRMEARGFLRISVDKMRENGVEPPPLENVEETDGEKQKTTEATQRPWYNLLRLKPKRVIYL